MKDIAILGLALIGVLAEPVQAQKPIPFKKADHTLIAYGKQKRQFLHLWLPDSKTPTPLVLHYHGGGFLGGSIRNKTYGRTAATFNAAGIAFAEVEYRLLPQTLLHEIMRDCARAIQFLRHNADTYNLDKTRVAAFGESAGAGASLWLATKDDLADPQSTDPVLRESSRLTAAGGIWVQSTYDIVQWPKLLDLPPERTPFWSLLQLVKKTMTPERFNQLRKDLDMLAHLDKQDPPLHFTPGTRGQGVHSHRFVTVLQAQAKRVGARLTIKDGRDELIQFLTVQLTAPRQPRPDPSTPHVPCAAEMP
ncbi:MAG: alpha/beta hydrolase [Planctomycetaceae bacterium]